MHAQAFQQIVKGVKNSEMNHPSSDGSAVEIVGWVAARMTVLSNTQGTVDETNVEGSLSGIRACPPLTRGCIYGRVAMMFAVK